jgi:GNAT superfamily N-acetyltransferase
MQKLPLGSHQMSIFGDEFDDGSFCWMIEDDELWLSMIIVKEEHRRKGVLHRLLDVAKKFSDVVVIPEPLGVVPRTAAKHGYVPAKRWIEDYGEHIDVMEWRR